MAGTWKETPKVFHLQGREEGRSSPEEPEAAFGRSSASPRKKTEKIERFGILMKKNDTAAGKPGSG